ncbi:MAG: PIG-L family deacetylase [Vicingaceae bacterium]
MKLNLLAMLIFLPITSLFSQRSSSELIEELGRLKSPYRIMYLAAHPDDENTRLISYLTGHLKADVAYLSLTRGSGGQNLIGPEKGPHLGILRTEELLAARRIDHGRQFFTRAIDFGYSKTSEESFTMWGEQEVLHDVVYIMRHFKPHIVIDRFPPNNYAGHGHHQASAILSDEAFDLCSDSVKFPMQIDRFGIWSPSRLYFNSSSWWDKTLPERAKNDQLIKEINVGVYNENLGYSYNELSAFSRSQHKSQGFGSAASRGDQFEYLEFIKGEVTNNELLNEGMLDEADRSWLALSTIIDSIIDSFDFNHPDASVPKLIALRRRVVDLATNHVRFNEKLSLLDNIIFGCLGLNVEVTCQKPVFTDNQEIIAQISAINRSSVPTSLIEVQTANDVLSWNRMLENNVVFTDTFLLAGGESLKFSNPFWIGPEGDNLYHFDPEYLTESSSQVNFPKVKVKLAILGDSIEREFPVIYQWTDRVKGGLEKNISILPEVTIAFDQRIYFPDSGAIRGNVLLKVHGNSEVSGRLVFRGDTSLHLKSDDEIVIKNTGAAILHPFELGYSSLDLSNATIKMAFVTNNDTFDLEYSEIVYDHIRPQMALLPCAAKVVPVEFGQSPGRIAYIPGPDNEMIEYLRDAGCEIEDFDESDFLSDKLSSFDVLLFGIRSLNVNPNLNNYSLQVQSFIRSGGTAILLYQTSRGMESPKISPYPFTISRKRITDERAETKILKPEHPLLNKPFKITLADFDGWNQERGLYFADDRSEKFNVLFAWHDPEETDEFGGMIVAKYGKGAFIYTGISFFRHIPAGVSGSYKLLYNTLSFKPE